VSLEAITWAYRTTVGSSAQKAVLLVLANYADERDSAYPGIVRIAKMTQLSERTVQRAVAELEELQVIRVERTVNSVNRYHLDLSWKQRGGDTMTPGGGDTVSPGGVTVASDTQETHKRGHTNPMPAARVEPIKYIGKRNGLRATFDDGEGLASNRLPADEPVAEVTPIRGPSVGGLAKDFEREARTRFKLGDNRRVTNLTALRANIGRWHKQDGIPLEEIDAAMRVFWAGQHTKPDGEPWRRFINIFARMHAKATAPDISDPAYYTDQKTKKEIIEWTPETWREAQRVAREQRKAARAAVPGR
jgi:hypothetical protein